MAQSPRLQPPVNEVAVSQDSGAHTQAWTEYHQSVADQGAVLTAETASLTTQMGTKQNVQGVVDGSDAAAGNLGEYMTASGSGVAMTNATNATIATLNLTAGDWDVSGSVAFNAGAGTHTYFGAGIGGLDTASQATFPSTALSVQAISTSTHRYSLTATTAVSLLAQAGFTGTMSASGTIRARRVR